MSHLSIPVLLLRKWAAFEGFGRAERAIFALLVMQAEQHNAAVQGSYEDLARIMWADREAVRHAMRWLKARDVVDIDSTKRPMTFEITGRTIWIDSDLSVQMDTLSDEPSVQQSTLSDEPSVQQSTLSVSQSTLNRTDLNARLARDMEDHAQGFAENQPTNRVGRSISHEIDSNSHEFERTRGGKEIGRREKTDRRHKRAEKPRDITASDRGEILGLIKTILGRKGWSDVDTIHLKQLAIAQGKGYSREGLEEAVYRYLHGRLKAGDEEGSLDQPWLVPQAVKDWDAYAVAERVVQAEAEKPTPLKVVFCDYCREMVKAVEVEIEAAFAGHVRKTHPAIAAKRIG